MKSLLLLLLSFLMLSLGLSAQEITAIPDTSFEQILVNQGIDSDGVVNGYILTSDAESVTTLDMTADDYSPFAIITDLTGLEAFIHLDSLSLWHHSLDSLDISALTELTYLSCPANWIQNPIDFSNNPLLETVIIAVGTDWNPNGVLELDLSHNPLISKVVFAPLGGGGTINLNNGNNNADMFLDIGFSGPMSQPYPHVCIKVDDPQTAQNGGYPYSEWEINHGSITYSFTNDIPQCVLGTEGFEKSAVQLYPNPATDRVYVEGLTTAVEFSLYTLTGKRVKQISLVPEKRAISLTALESGLYLYSLSRAGKVVKTGKLIKR